MLRDWNQRFPGSADNIFAALSNVLPEHLMDRKLRFKGIDTFASQSILECDRHIVTI